MFWGIITILSIIVKAIVGMMVIQALLTTLFTVIIIGIMRISEKAVEVYLE